MFDLYCDVLIGRVNMADYLLVQESNEPQPPPTKRVASLDVFRGLTVLLMIFVDDVGGAYPRIDHAPWNGLTLAVRFGWKKKNILYIK